MGCGTSTVQDSNSKVQTQDSNSKAQTQDSNSKPTQSEGSNKDSTTNQQSQPSSKNPEDWSPCVTSSVQDSNSDGNSKPIQSEDSNKGSTANQQSQPSSKNTEDWSPYEKDALNAHNEYRSRHGVPPLTLNRDLCVMAQKYADELAKKNAFEHSNRGDRKYNGGSCGENLARTGSTGEQEPMPAETAVKMWYDEIKDYNSNNPGFSMATGHFTQVIWKDTKELGQGIASYTDGAWTRHVVVANYYPAGNVQGRFDTGVLPLI